MGEDVLKKPVHLAILKPTHVQKLEAAGRLPNTKYGVNVPEHVNLPKEKAKEGTLGLAKYVKPGVPHSQIAKQAKRQVQLSVVYDRLPKIPEDKKPPCESCKTAACCVAFVVNISDMEYESGLFGDAAIKITPDMFSQLKNRFLTSVMLSAPQQYAAGRDAYFLEGKVGEPCPFLRDDKKCGIYDIRPATCRTYTCVGDSRITEEMRQGTEGLDPVARLSAKLKHYDK